MILDLPLTVADETAGLSRVQIGAEECTPIVEGCDDNQATVVTGAPKRVRAIDLRVVSHENISHVDLLDNQHDRYDGR